MSSKASRRTEPQDDLDAILMTGGVAEGVGIDEHEGEDLDMRRLRIENTNAMGKPQSNAISFRPKRR